MDDGQKIALPPPAQKSRRLPYIAALSVLSLSAVGLGIGGGLLMASNIEKIVIEKHKAKAEAGEKASGPYSGDIVLKKVAPVVTNLADSKDDWVRIETSIVYRAASDKNPDVMAAETRQDLLAFLRTISIAHLQGPSGLLHLREDLNERVRTRSNGDIQEIILETLVVQ